MADLELATVDELYEELEKRCKECVFIFSRPLKNNERDYAFSIRHTGFLSALGLVEQAKFYLHTKYNDNFENINPSEIGLED